MGGKNSVRKNAATFMTKVFGSHYSFGAVEDSKVLETLVFSTLQRIESVFRPSFYQHRIDRHNGLKTVIGKLDFHCVQHVNDAAPCVNLMNLQIAKWSVGVPAELDHIGL